MIMTDGDGDEVRKVIHFYPDGRCNSTSASEYLGISPKTLAMYRCKGGVGPEWVKLGGKIFYFKS